MFHKEFESVDDLKLIVDKADGFNNKMKILKPVDEKKEGVSFSRLVLIIEDSRGIPISDKTKLFKFKEMYDIEIEKQNKAA
jgi:intein-encoded DNA endonuclease-like protein